MKLLRSADGDTYDKPSYAKLPAELLNDAAGDEKHKLRGAR